jgi:hypothetical protein
MCLLSKEYVLFQILGGRYFLISMTAQVVLARESLIQTSKECPLIHYLRSKDFLLKCDE